MSLDGLRIGISLPVRELENDLAAIRDFAQSAEELGFTHLRVPDMLVRPGGGHLHEPLTLFSWVAALTSAIELVPSVIILPVRQTALVAKQAAEIDVLSGGRLRLGVGVGAQRRGVRGARSGLPHARPPLRRADRAAAAALDAGRGALRGPLGPHRGRGHQPAAGAAPDSNLDRPGRWWRRAARPRAAPHRTPLRRLVRDHPARRRAGGQRAHPRGSRGGRTRPLGDRRRGAIGLTGKQPGEWLAEAEAWTEAGATHLCLRTLGGGLDAAGHLAALHAAREALDAA